MNDIDEDLEVAGAPPHPASWLANPTGGGPRRPRVPLTAQDVLVVGMHYRPDAAGTGPWAAGIAEHLAGRARSVTVLTGLPHTPATGIDERYRGHRRLVQAPADGAGPTVVRIGHHVSSGPSGLGRARYETSFARRALLARLPRRPDLVIGVTPSPGGAAAAARIARRHGVPLLLAVHDLVGRAGGRDDALAWRLERRLERYALDRADWIVVAGRALSPAVAATGVPWERIGLVPDWQPHPVAVTDRDSARASLGWSRDAFVVVHTGPMDLAQDLGSVVDAATRLPHDVHVLLAGDGRQRPALAARALGVPNVRLTGPLEGERHALTLAAADLLLVHERPGQGAVRPSAQLRAYLAAGRPVLAAVAGVGPTAAEIRRTGGAGLVVRPAEPAVLAAAVLQLRDEPALRAAMGRRAAAYVHTEPARRASLRALDALLDGVMA